MLMHACATTAKTTRVQTNRRPDGNEVKRQSEPAGNASSASAPRASVGRNSLQRRFIRQRSLALSLALCKAQSSMPDDDRQSRSAATAHAAVCTALG